MKRCSSIGAHSGSWLQPPANTLCTSVIQGKNNSLPNGSSFTLNYPPTKMKYVIFTEPSVCIGFSIGKIHRSETERVYISDRRGIQMRMQYECEYRCVYRKVCVCEGEGVIGPFHHNQTPKIQFFSPLRLTILSRCWIVVDVSPHFSCWWNCPLL